MTTAMSGRPQLNGNQVLDSLDLGNAGNPAWHVVTTGDFNGDGKSDLLWQNDDGHVWETQLNGDQVDRLASISAMPATRPGMSWRRATSTATARPTSCGRTTTAMSG